MSIGKLPASDLTRIGWLDGLTLHVEKDLSSFEDWRNWKPETLASHVSCLLIGWEQRRGKRP